MWGTHFLCFTVLWAGVIVQITMSIATSATTSESPEASRTQASENEVLNGYAWSAWSSWSPCSRTCGGGVSMQDRQCLPRSLSNAANGTLPPPVVTVRVTRQLHNTECLGIDKRFRECNTQPCPSSSLGMRAEQCAAYDRRPFRGRFFTWVPYIDGDSPCTLNCRPLGQHFYASLALVADGTPCTRPGYRAMCVQGMCKIVGRETVLASPGSHELRCGRRLVSGLFSRPRLPLGYSYVTTVPRGACRLNVSEILPSDNYIALKISNGSYIINGDFAVSIPGNYDAAGARFVYSRAAGVDKIFAYGPLLQPIDIMILYTEPNPSITYEYFVQSLDSQDETETLRADAPESPVAATEHSRRHQISFIFKSTGSSARPDVFGVEFDGDSNKDVDDGPTGGRKFSWKVMGYTQCSRSCGGGIQIAKYRCVETIPSEGDREVSSIHCSGPSPPPRRRRCGAGPCAPRWRSATWSPCPQCGPANRTRIVGCVQDHSRGITKISDQKCPPQKPVTFEKCNIPDCKGTDNYGVRYVEPKRSKPVELTESFRYGPEYSVAVNSTYFDIGPEYTFSAPGGWLYTEWSECTGWCVGGGLQTRAVRCADPSGCAPRRAPDTARPCALPAACEPLEGQWFTGDWSECSSPCNGKQIRGVLCVGGTGRHLRDSACKEARPSNERECASEDCEPTWFISDWGKCISNCTGKPFGVSRRSVVCARGGMSDAPVNELECAAATRPHASRDCVPRCPSQMTQPPEFIVESERSTISDTTTPFTTTTTTHKEELMSIEVRPVNKKGCKDKLPNCFLAVQARLCHYSYYIQNCCHSCKGK